MTTRRGMTAAELRKVPSGCLRFPNCPVRLRKQNGLIVDGLRWCYGPNKIANIAVGYVTDWGKRKYQLIEYVSIKPLIKIDGEWKEEGK